MVNIFHSTIYSILEQDTVVYLKCEFFFFSKVTALQSAQGRGTATVQQIGGGGDSVVLGEPFA